ncbi:hypothetical protein NQZ68_007486 [Dissostichus eleginoides]|nr:hypothetical protein NQZ68_007486 [Dissostichus eleginoides]
MNQWKVKHRELKIFLKMILLKSKTFKHPRTDLSPGISMVTVCRSSRTYSHWTGNLKFIIYL